MERFFDFSPYQALALLPLIDARYRPTEAFNEVAETVDQKRIRELEEQVKARDETIKQMANELEGVSAGQEDILSSMETYGNLDEKVERLESVLARLEAVQLEAQPSEPTVKQSSIVPDVTADATSA